MSDHVSHRAIALGLAIAVLAACSAEPPPAAPPLLLSKEAAARRSTVPFTRPIALDRAGAVADLQFELPPPGPGAVPELMVGMRVQAEQVKDMHDVQDRIIRDGLAAKVHLWRIDGSTLTAMPLTYATRDLVNRVPVGEDGSVPYVTSLGVADSMLREVGLVDEKLVYGALNIASMQHALPGPYRLSIELIADRPDLRSSDIELVVGYSRRVK